MGSRRVLAVSRAPQHVERDLLLIEAEGLAPIGLVLVLVGVRLFERAGRRHRKQLETIAAAAQRIGDGERDVALVAGRSEVGRVAGSLEQLANGLRELDRERGLYVSQVSHDLRNPLAVIGTYASVLRRGERSRPRAAKLQTIEDEVSRLALMVDDLLALGRTHALAMHIQRAPADVRALVHDAVATARARSGRTRVLLLAPAGPMTAVVDAQRLRQALDNLLDNAIRHARSEVRVELACSNRRTSWYWAWRTTVRASTGCSCRASSKRSPRAPTASAVPASVSRRCAPLPRLMAAASAWVSHEGGVRASPCAFRWRRPGRSSREPIRCARADARAVAGGNRPRARAPGPRARIAPRGRRVADCGTGPAALAGRGGDRARTRCRRGADRGLRPHAVHAHAGSTRWPVAAPRSDSRAAISCCAGHCVRAMAPSLLRRGERAVALELATGSAPDARLLQRGRFVERDRPRPEWHAGRCARAPAAVACQRALGWHLGDRAGAGRRRARTGRWPARRRAAAAPARRAP